LNSFLFNAPKTLQSNTFLGLIVGENIITLQRVSSTNDYLKHNLSKSTPYTEGTVIMADDQYAGKGQAGNIWKSEAGKNLTCSILLCPTFLPPKTQFSLNIAVSLAIIQLLKPLLGEELSIKWPNDIYYKDKKLGGILIENIIRGTTWKHAIVGIGINVNQLKFETDKACSLKALTNKHLDIHQLLISLCHALSMQYQRLKQGDFTQQRQEYKLHLYRFGVRSPFIHNNYLRYGNIINITDEGRLIINFDGEIADFGIKEISFQ